MNKNEVKIIFYILYSITKYKAFKPLVITGFKENFIQLYDCLRVVNILTQILPMKVTSTP